LESPQWLNDYPDNAEWGLWLIQPWIFLWDFWITKYTYQYQNWWHI